MRFILSILLSLFIGALSAQPCFNKTYGDDEGNLGVSVVVTDSGYLVCGIGYSPIYNEWLVTKFLRIDSFGSLKEMKLLGEVSYGYRIGEPGSLTETFDGNYIYGGSCVDSSQATSQGILCKLNKDGDTLWMKRFGVRNINYYYFNLARPTRDSGYVCVGMRQQGQLLYFYALKTDSLGQLEWQRTYGLPGLGNGYSIEQTTDGGYIMAGVSDADGTGSGKIVPFVVKTDAAGQVEWQKNYASPGFHGPAKIIPSTFGGYYLLVNLETIAVAEQYSLYRLDSTGTVVWNYRFPSMKDTYIGQVKELTDGSLVAVGQTPLPGIFWSGGLIVKISPTGQLIWQREYPRNNLAGMNVQGGFSGFRCTPDMGYVITGGAIVDTGGGHYNNDFWLIKTDSMGCIGTDCGVTGINEIPTNTPNLLIYPNPATNQVTIDCQQAATDDAQWTVYNLLSQQIATGKMQGQPNIKLDVSGYNKGWYMVRIATKDNSYVGKFLVE